MKLNSKCQELVKLKEFHEHTVKKNCSQYKDDLDGSQSFYYKIPSTFLLSEPEKSHYIEVIEESIHASLKHFTRFDKTFYFFATYNGDMKMFIFFVMMAEDSKAAEDFTVKISITNEDSMRKTSHEFPVLSIDDVPDISSSDTHSKCWCIDYRAMKPLLRLRNIGTEVYQQWKATFRPKIEILKKSWN